MFLLHVDITQVLHGRDSAMCRAALSADSALHCMHSKFLSLIMTAEFLWRLQYGRHLFLLVTPFQHKNSVLFCILSNSLSNETLLINIVIFSNDSGWRQLLPRAEDAVH